MTETPRDKNPLSATVLPPRPGDFTLRCAKSRAAARALVLARQPKMTTEDLECLLIHRISGYLHAGAWPSYDEMEKLPVWQRGWELIRASKGFNEWRENMRQLGAGKLGKCTFASREFVSAFGREPSVGDVLNWTDLKPSITAEHVNDWRVLWERRVPEYPFPFKHERGFLCVRVADYRSRVPGTRTIGGFEPLWSEVPQYRWSWIEDEALEYACRWSKVQRQWKTGTEIDDIRPTIPAVIFCEGDTIKPAAQ